MSSFYVKYMNYNIYYSNCYILLMEIVMIIIMNNYEVNFFLSPRQGTELTLFEGEGRK